MKDIGKRTPLSFTLSLRTYNVKQIQPLMKYLMKYEFAYNYKVYHNDSQTIHELVVELSWIRNLKYIYKVLRNFDNIEIEEYKTPKKNRITTKDI